MRSASIGLRVFAKATSSANVVLTFPSGKKKLDASARTALRDLIATAPKGVRTMSVVTGEMRNSDADTAKLARQRAKKVVTYLKTAGLAGPFDIAVSAVPQKHESARVTVAVTWRA